jgi:hypothetical protein
VIHRWDLGQALGHDITLDDAEMDRVESAVAGFGDNLYAEGICRPACEVPADASRQIALQGTLVTEPPLPLVRVSIRCAAS